MIHSRITAKAQTTIPRSVRAALGVEAGDALSYEIDGDRVILRRALFTEWASEADCKAFDNL